MKLDFFINIKLLELSKKYDISLVEILVPNRKGRKTWISRTINFNYRPKKSKKTKNSHLTFYNKKDLASWLMCLE